jgi:putative oxygen-independent coproporphyrinogen III oxidase
VAAAQHGWRGIGHSPLPHAAAGPAPTLYVGGGTPSRLCPDDLERLCAAVATLPGAEVTIEANPEDVTAKWAAAAGRAGATRVSLGVQSLDPAVLRGLGRVHDPAAVARAAGALAEAGIDSYSVDLIYGGANETDGSWRATLAGVLALDPPPSHVSAYALTVEAGTPLWRDQSRHPDDDVQADRYEAADRMLSEAGLFWYEISNWARPGFECRHNLNYWAEGDYLGIGAAAHGHIEGRRYWNVRTPERYVASVGEGREPLAGEETVDPETREIEALELSLRTRFGVPAECLPLDEDESLHRLVEPVRSAEEGMEGHVVLTLAGRLLANEVACRLLSGVRSRETHREPILVACPNPFGG